MRNTTVFALLVLAMFLAPRPAAAQGFITPYIGWNFAGEATCPDITGCDKNNTTFGFAFGALGPVVGFEEEIGYTKDFFGSTATESSSVLTVMSNLVLNIPIPVVRPYAVGGVGLMKSDFEPTIASVTSITNNTFGWDLGGGLIVGSKHVGVRGDIRYFNTFEDVPLVGILLKGNEKLNFGRVSVGLFLGF